MVDNEQSIDDQFMNISDSSGDYDESNLSIFTDPVPATLKRKYYHVYKSQLSKRVNTFYILWFYYLFPDRKSEITFLYYNHLQSPAVTEKLTHLLFFCPNPFTQEHIFGTSLIYDYYYYNRIHDQGTIGFPHTHRKFSFLREFLRNTFLTSENKDAVITVFCMIQKIYRWLTRRIYLWHYKKTEVAVNTDLCFNDITVESKYVFPLRQENKLFYFTTADLFRIIKNALSQEHESGFQVISHYPKNPYNNKLLSTTDLFNFYFHVKFVLQAAIPLYFELWFLEDFNINTFTLKHESMIKKFCIQNYIQNASNTNTFLQRSIESMLDEFSSVCPWRIHPQFPKTILLDKLRQYLYVYFLICYDAIDYNYLHTYETLLELKLKRCYYNAPHFGSVVTVESNTNSLPKSLFSLDSSNNIVINEPEPETTTIDSSGNEHSNETVEKLTFYTDCLQFTLWNC